MDTSAPPAPTLVSPANGSTTNDSTPYFDWNNASGATLYQIQVDDNSNFGSPAVDATTSSSNYTSGALGSATYYWRVRARDAAGNWSGWSSVWTVTVDTSAPPVAPSNLNATAVSTTQINLTWNDNSDNETGFKIERSLNGSSWSQIAIIGANNTSYSNTGLSCGTTYYYRVRAYNDSGNSSYSNTDSAATSTCPPNVPAAPSNLNATAVSTSQINLTWNDNSNNETGFKIYRSPDESNWSQIATVSTNSTSYANTGLNCGTIYYYRVRAYNGSGDSSYSNTTSTTTSDCASQPPSIPQILPPRREGSNYILSWEPSIDPDSPPSAIRYWVQVFEEDLQTLKAEEQWTISESSYSWPFDPVNDVGTYYWRVKASDGINESSWSAFGEVIIIRKEGVIDLSISLYRTPSLAEHAAYEEILGYFADAIYEASNGKHKIGNITIYQNGQSQDTADIRWGASVWPHAYVSGYGIDSMHVFMGDIFPFPNSYDALSPANRRGAGYALAHEWGHYYYGLYDEYRNPYETCPNGCGIGTPLPTDTPVPNSIMNSQWNATGGDYNWLNFSVAKNIYGDNAQRRVYGASGWDTLRRPVSEDPRNGERQSLPSRIFYPELGSVAPGAGEDASLELPTTPSTITRSELNIVWEPTTMQYEEANSTSYWATINYLGGNIISYPQSALLIASAGMFYPIAQAEVTAVAIDPDNNTIPLTLRDDGAPPDTLADDGLYSGYMPYYQSGVYTVTVTFNNQYGNAVFTQLSTLASPGPNGEMFTPVFEPVEDNFTIIKQTNVTVVGVQSDDHGDSVATATWLTANNIDVPGQIDYAGDVDTFKIVPDVTEQVAIRVTDVGMEMQPEIQIIDKNGVIMVNSVTSVAVNSYFYYLLDAQAGEPVYIKISHVDDSANQGYYNVSAGTPLFNEQHKVYLPVIIR
ncbi:MAG: hypothetical protein D6711_18910 [Chloroflexi bacterium]|nr:MAG: hypothetical protein D6711_18910 [Chloroflexota bacterium]